MSQCKVPLPDTPDRYLGIELEMRDICNRDPFSTLPAFRDCVVVNFESLGHVDGYEAKFLVKEVDLDRLFPIFIDTLVKAGGTVDSYCGFHVHIDCRVRNWITVQNRMNEAATILRGFSTQVLHRERQGVASRRQYATVECRVMEACFDTERLLRYIHKLIEIVDHVPQAIAA